MLVHRIGDDAWIARTGQTPRSRRRHHRGLPCGRLDSNSGRNRDPRRDLTGSPHRDTERPPAISTGIEQQRQAMRRCRRRQKPSSVVQQGDQKRIATGFPNPRSRSQHQARIPATRRAEMSFEPHQRFASHDCQPQRTANGSLMRTDVSGRIPWMRLPRCCRDATLRPPCARGRFVGFIHAVASPRLALRPAHAKPPATPRP